MNEKWLLIALPMYQRFARDIVRGVGRFAQVHGQWHVVPPRAVGSVMQRNHLVAGALIQPNLNDPAIEHICKRVESLGLPRVYVGALREYPDHVVVRGDNRAIGRMAAEHLRGLGLQALAFVGGGDALYARHRREGFEAAARAMDAELCEPPGDASLSGPAPDLEKLRQWLATAPRPLGIFAQNDEIAAHVSTACRLASIRCPDDVAILGVDNDDVLCSMTRPALSSIDTGFDRLGFRAAQVIERMINGESLEPHAIELPPLGVVKRGSTHRLAVQDPMVTEALRQIRDHAHDPTTNIEKIAACVDKSRRSLERRFRHAMGRSLHQELVRIRMEHARRMLAESEEPVERIAPACG
ncbi:MAG: substrate-binding domain-containing protein, partial [Phycisphaeraceae bacterium]